MRRLDETPIDPEIAAALDAIDATLAGEPVDPRHAEFAELALLLADERPVVDVAFARLLDESVARRFAKAPARTTAAAPRRRRRWAYPAGGLTTAGVAAIVAVVVLSGGSPPRANLSAGSPPGRTPASTSSPAVKAPSTHGVPTTAYRPGSTGTSQSSANTAAGRSSSGGSFGTGTASSSASGSLAATSAPAPTVLAPAPNGRKIVQSAQLQLSTAPRRVDEVAQEVFTVVGEQNGIVENSSVTQGGPNGYAQFQLSMPSGSLSQAMAALSTLRYASVASRTDATQDVNNQYESDVRALADARALRTALLKQLANATTQAQIDSLTAQIHDADASISSDEATLRSLNQRVDYSQVALTINAAPIIATPSKGGSSFTIGKAAHDAGRVLTVAAGVALIVAAALVPLALLAALAWWIGAALRRRRREQSLDVV